MPVTEIGFHPKRLDLTVHAGDPIDVSVAVLDGDGDAQNLDGWTVSARAIDPTGGAVLHDFAPTASAGSIRVQATPAQTGAWAWASYAARLVVAAAPPSGAASPVTLGWIRLYRH
jgi:hypothetical protein